MSIGFNARGKRVGLSTGADSMGFFAKMRGAAAGVAASGRGVLRRLNPLPFLRSRFVVLSARTTVRLALAVSTAFIVLIIHRRIFAAIEGYPEYQFHGASLPWKGRPAWAPADPQVVADIAPDIRRGEANLFDDRLVPFVAAKLKSDPWVRPETVRVERSFDRGLTARFDLRRPHLVVERREGYFLVDREGFRLPGAYARRPILDPAVAVYPVRGIPGPLPAAGARWEDPGIAAALDVSDVLQGYGVSGMVAAQAIDVANAGGRINPLEPEILIWAEQGVAIRWGRPRSTDVFGEPDVKMKLQALAMTLRQYPRLTGLASVDVRFLDRSGLSPSPVVTLRGGAVAKNRR